MSPKTNICLHIVCWQSIFSCKGIKSTEYIIYHIISEDTVCTVDDTIKLSWFMETKSVSIIDSFSCRDIFSPAEFELISVPVDLWRGNNRMPCGICYYLWCMHEYFTYLLFFHFELFLVGYWEPSTSSVHLEVIWEFCFEWRFFDDTKDLSLDSIGTILEDTNIDYTLWYSTSWNKYLLPCRIATKSYTSENKLLNEDIF